MAYGLLAFGLLAASVVIYFVFRKEEQPEEIQDVFEKKDDLAPETTVSLSEIVLPKEPVSTPPVKEVAPVVEIPVEKKKAPVKKTAVKKKTNE